MIIDSANDKFRFGIHYESSDWFCPDYIANLLLQRIIGDYKREAYHNFSENEDNGLIT